MTIPNLSDFMLFGAWDGVTLTILLFTCGAVSRGCARLDKMRGPTFARSERICRVAGTIFTGLGALGFLASWSTLPQHQPGIWGAMCVVLTVLIIIGWYSIIKQMRGR